MKKIYGAYNHAELKKQNYTKIFSKMKTEVSGAVKDGSFAKVGDKDKVVTKVKEGKVMDWKSAKGTTIKARLVAVEDGKVFVFETEKGKTIRAKEDQLAKESVKKAREMAGL